MKQTDDVKRIGRRGCWIGALAALGVLGLLFATAIIRYAPEVTFTGGELTEKVINRYSKETGLDFRRFGALKSLRHMQSLRGDYIEATISVRGVALSMWAEQALRHNGFWITNDVEVEKDDAFVRFIGVETNFIHAGWRVSGEEIRVYRACFKLDKDDATLGLVSVMIE